ncbi:MAG: biotin transporter BioY [Tateyamaria sp.]|jgi:biotin transport system substrate-specific component|nr:biotin transporter BioY [Tateyamaria sp.]MBT5302780.1 biotin transporter BioY [Tateyamaria sp.]MBT6268669.1 biotin transporter BioY [Tateyamaria sp.]MBT6343090.1 biotin transporter BioY [Tateyamaria sp.]MBT7448251.1 biotin transporter BioY [Tateyamaria sp.]
MALTMNKKVLTEAFGASEGALLWLKQILLVVTGVMALAIAAKVKIPMTPVPITLGTLAVLTIGSAYGPRLGLATILGYLIIGALGFDVFATSSASNSGLDYMVGGTGGYLVGYVVATLALGKLARMGWDRTAPKMACAMLLGNLLIYIPGLIWLGALYGWDQPILQWGLTPFIIGDLLKLAVAAMLLPLAWKVIGKTRS